MQRIIAEINHHLASCVADLSFEMDKKQWWDRCSALWHLSRWKLSCCRKIISVPEIFDDFRELFPYNFPHFYCCYCFQSPQYRDRINSFKTKLLWLSGQRKEQFSSLKDMVYKSKSLDSFDAKAAETFNAPSWKPEKKMWSKYEDVFWILWIQPMKLHFTGSHWNDLIIILIFRAWNCNCLHNIGFNGILDPLRSSNRRPTLWQFGLMPGR